MRALRLTFKTGRPQCGGLFGESTGYSQLDLGQAVDGLNTILGEHRILAQIAECDECNKQLSGSKAAYRHGISVEDWSAVKGQKPGTELKVGPHNMDCPPTRWTYSPRTAVQRAP